MYSRNNSINNSINNLIIIKPKYHVIHFLKNNSFFNKIIGYNNIKVSKSYIFNDIYKS